MADEPVPFLQVSQFPSEDMRILWLRGEWKRHPLLETGDRLERLLRASEAGDAQAREAVVWVVQLAISEPSFAVLEHLRRGADVNNWLHLRRFLQTNAALPSHVPAGFQRVPDYGKGRELSLGERRSLARRPTRRDFDRLLSDPHPMVINLLLGNPRTVEDDVVRLATRRPARVELLAEIARRPRWMGRARIRQSFLLNPGTPLALAAPLLYLSTRQELVEVAEAASAQAVLRRSAQELMDQRPPLPPHVQQFPEMQ